MRSRAEILHDGIRETDKHVIIPEFSDKLRLLELEVLVDIRDVLKGFLDKGSTWETRFIKTQ